MFVNKKIKELNERLIEQDNKINSLVEHLKTLINIKVKDNDVTAIVPLKVAIDTIMKYNNLEFKIINPDDNIIIKRMIKKN